MTLLRSTLFNVAFFGWTALCALAFVPTLAMPRRVVQACIRRWAAGVDWLLIHVVGLTTRVDGREHISDTAVVIAAKHQSAWDTILFHLLLPHPAYVLKRELMHIPFYGWYTRKAGSIAINRKAGGSAIKAMVRDARTALAEGQQVIIFPEGTRTAPGRSLPYLPGIAALYAQLETPVVPVALNSGLFWGRRNFIKRPGCMVVEFLQPIPPGLGRERFMSELEQRIETATNALVAKASVDNSVDDSSAGR